MLRYLLVLALAGFSWSQSHADTFRFGAWGDMPYTKNGDMAKMPALIHSLNQADIAFSLYDGDIKDGSSECNTASFDQAEALFKQLRQPVVYIPGDNEWTDCHRLNNGGYNNLERLAYLRQRFFAKPESQGQKHLSFTQQGPAGGEYAENLRFSYKGVVFVGLNVPGSNNNKVQDDKDCTKKSARTVADCAADNAEYLARNAANIDWLKSSFAEARRSSAVALVLTIQADPGFDLPETEDSDESRLPQYEGYRSMMTVLAEETAAYAGQVLLIHGDTHTFKVDKPLYGPWNPLPNFTRLQTFGSPSIHWVEVSVDTQRPEVFTIRPVMVRP